MESLLNKQSGLLGISGLTHDMRDLLAEAQEHDDRRAWLAVEIFAYRARKYIGAYLAAMGGADAVVFTGGIGENSAEVRAADLRRAASGWGWSSTRARTQEAVRGARARDQSRREPRLAAWVIPTDEELLIARDTVRLVEGLDTRF